MEERSRARDVLSLLMQRLGEAGVDGVLFGDPRPALDAAGSEEVGLRIEVETSVPYDRAADLRTIVARALAFASFADLESFASIPVASTRRFVVSMELVAFDPHRALRSNAAQGALERVPPAEWWSAADAACRAVVGAFATENPDWADALRRRQLVARIAYGGDEEEWARALAPLPEEIRFALEDVRVLTEVHRSQHDGAGYVDEWLRESLGPKGRRFRRPVWHPVLGEDGSASPFSVGLDDVEEVGGVKAPLDLAALAVTLEDTSREQRVRIDAVRSLAAAGSEGASLAIRALAFDDLRGNALAYVNWPELQPLFREIAFAKDTGRVPAAFACLRGWKRTLQQVEQAWTLAAGMTEDRRLGELDQSSILREYARTGDRTVVPLLIEGIEDGTRSEEWRRSAMRALEDFEAAEAAPAVFRVALANAGPGDAPFSDPVGLAGESMSFFAKVPHPPAKALLVRGMRTASLCSAFAIDALARMGDDGLPPLVEEAGKMARTAYEGDKTWAESTASALVRAFIARRQPDGTLPVTPEILRALADIAPHTRDDVEDALLPAKPAGIEEDESAVRGSNARETYDKRRALWLTPGFAIEQYKRSGHRGAWDALVVAAHERYNRTVSPGADPALRGEYAKALEMGCRDGIVAYRDAVVRVLAGEPVDERRFRNAAEWMAPQYPHSPYVSSAWVKVAEVARGDGRAKDALEAARRSVAGDAHDPDAMRILADLEAKAAALSRAATLRDLSLGRLVAVPSIWHEALVVSMHISPDGRKLVTVDMRGCVQVSRIIPGATFPRLVPDVRERLHEGPALAQWTSPDTFVTRAASGPTITARYSEASSLDISRSAESVALSANAAEQRDANGDWTASLTHSGGITVTGHRGGRGTMASGGSLGRFAIYHASFAHRVMAWATEHHKLGVTAWGN